MAELDADKHIRWAVDSGKVSFGQRSVEKSILNGKGQLVIVSGNAQKAVAERISALSKVAGIPLHTYPGTAGELGSVCGKPFVVSAMVVLDAGKSKVLEISKNRESAAAQKSELAQPRPSRPSKAKRK